MRGEDNEYSLQTKKIRPKYVVPIEDLGVARLVPLQTESRDPARADKTITIWTLRTETMHGNDALERCTMQHTHTIPKNTYS